MNAVRVAQARAKKYEIPDRPCNPLRAAMNDWLAAGYMRDLEDYRAGDANRFVRMAGGIRFGESPQYGSEDAWIGFLTGMLCSPEGHVKAVTSECREGIRAFLRIYCTDDVE